MPTLRSEDAGRNLRSPWLGPTNAWRWWFDMEYTHWAVGVLAFMVFGTLFSWVLPAAVPVGFGVWAYTRWAVGRQRSATLARLVHSEPAQAPRRARRILVVVLGLILVGLAPSWRAWALPMPLLVSIAAALCASIAFVRAARPWIDGNRPVAYWWRTMKAIANGARPARAAVEIRPAGSPAVNSTPLDDDLADFLAAGLAVDPKEIHVKIARQRTVPVEVMLWDSRTGDPETCEHVISWLKAKEVAHTVLGVDYREGLTGRYRIRVRVRLDNRDGEQNLIDGTVLVLSPHENGGPDRVTQMPPAEFARLYEEVPA